MSNKVIIIDIREEHELRESWLEPKDGNVEIVNIPSRNIFANVDWVRVQSSRAPVWILCASGNRSKKVKDMYFPNNQGIRSAEIGVKQLKSFDTQSAVSLDEFTRDRVVVRTGDGGLGLQQYMQLAFVMMLTIVGMSIYLFPTKTYSLAIIGLMITFILSQTLTKGCLMSKVLPWSSR